MWNYKLRGLNQESSLQRSSDTRWGSHYGTLMKLIILFPSVIDVLEVVPIYGKNFEQKGGAYDLLSSIQSFEFIFNMHFDQKCFGNYKWVVTSIAKERSKHCKSYDIG